ncbi:hypothetical protein C8F04DRAFT_1353171 [Mycena alexandri]|uniref:F-box domain-containing protein n=1 Tax=Mycena alexandri TaxID=1745969 RepID=A0AAD6SWP9_9AGAR|nr:hypothetical protein C8F04DRAFT_1353171 [Mycena alexandri]
MTRIMVDASRRVSKSTGQYFWAFKLEFEYAELCLSLFLAFRPASRPFKLLLAVILRARSFTRLASWTQYPGMPISQLKMGGKDELPLNSKPYPVLILPTEIVVEIFLHFLPVYPLCPPLVGIESPTTLSQIYHDWREIALATPALWRAISFFNGGCSFERQVAISNTWIRRSHPLPLSLRSVAPTRDSLDAIVPHFLPHRERWEYLCMHGVDTLTAFDGPMPLLRHLDLYVRTPRTAVITFNTAPLLHSVALIYTSANIVGLPWAQVTTLRLTGPFMSSVCVSILRQTSNLVHCELQTLAYEAAAPDVTLLRLESLKLTVNRLDEHPLQKALILPALRRLTLIEYDANLKSVPSLEMFLEKAGCARLEELHIKTSTPVLGLGAAYRTAFPSIPLFNFLY